MKWKLALILFCWFIAGATAGAALTNISPYTTLIVLVVAVTGLVLIVWSATAIIRPVKFLLRAMTGAVASYRDGDFSMSLSVDRDDELGQLLAAHNELGRALREQRVHLVERELLLDTVTQNSPMAIALIDNHERVAYANTAARQLLNDGRSLTGQDFRETLSRTHESLRTAILAGNDSLFACDMHGIDETFHLSTRPCLLQGRAHRLHLIKNLTRELSRQEVATWKKLIRVLSHELNNTLAPIASFAQSGMDIARRGDAAGSASIFAAISERTQHLHRFLQTYATFAKLPIPKPDNVAWRNFFEEISIHYPCRLAAPLPEQPAWFDRPQLGQALLNLLKNAHEAGGPPDQIAVSVSQTASEYCIEVCDRGPGMSETVMSQALMPFYSTKRTGTGIGLALTREIAEAHGGRVQLSNRRGGGLRVTIVLPVPSNVKASHSRIASTE